MLFSKLSLRVHVCSCCSVEQNCNLDGRHSPAGAGPASSPAPSPGATYPVKYGKHHVELLLLLLLGHVARGVAQFREEASQVHQAQSIVLGAALLLPGPPHDPLHHVHLERLCQGKGGPADGRKEVKDMWQSIATYKLLG